MGPPGILDLLLPRSCVLCGSRIVMEAPPASGVVCPPCRGRWRPPPGPLCHRCGHPLGTLGPAAAPGSASCLQCREWVPELERVRAATEAGPHARGAVHALKYRGWREIAPDLAVPMARVLAELRQGWDRTPVLVPVPTSPRRARRRGFNQARALAEAVAGSGLPGADCPVLPDLLSRASGRSQVGLHPQERWANVSGKVRCPPLSRRGLEGRPVILVDDVLTTGATLCAAARSLADSGSGPVRGLVFARASSSLDPGPVPTLR